MKNQKIAFIICVNDEVSYEECLYYIERLFVPEGFEIEVFVIREADSIYSAYNQAMNISDAKYKIYMHQDVFLINRSILQLCVDLFKSNARIGLIGLMGGKSYPVNRRFYRSWDTGHVLGNTERGAFCNKLDTEAAKVVAVDGMFMMTQYDLPWREDVLSGWDFYDFSQSIEFTRHGYEIWVPKQEEPWSIHDFGYLNFMNYDEGLMQFLKVYPEYFNGIEKLPEVYPLEYRKHLSTIKELKECWKLLLEKRQPEPVIQSLQEIEDERFYDTEIAIIKNVLEILKVDQAFLDDCNNFQEIYEKYCGIKFSIWREVFAKDKKTKLTSVSEAAYEVVKNYII